MLTQLHSLKRRCMRGPSVASEPLHTSASDIQCTGGTNNPVIAMALLRFAFLAVNRQRRDLVVPCGSALGLFLLSILPS